MRLIAMLEKNKIKRLTEYTCYLTDNMRYLRIKMKSKP